MFLPKDIIFAAIKVHFLQNKGLKFEPVGIFTVPLPCVDCSETRGMVDLFVPDYFSVSNRR